MSRSKKYSYFFWFISLIIVLIINGCASTQVTNNSGSLLHKVKVGTVEFSKNLDYCSNGCSTGFKWVTEGKNKISLQLLPLLPQAPWTTIGNLGPFVRFKHYSVNIIRNANGDFCAELWIRYDAGDEFNNDTTKDFVESHCFE